MSSQVFASAPAGVPIIPPPASAAGAGVEVQDDGATIVAAATVFNFTGDGVTVTDVAGVATIDIPGAAAATLQTAYDAFGIMDVEVATAIANPFQIRADDNVSDVLFTFTRSAGSTILKSPDELTSAAGSTASPLEISGGAGGDATGAAATGGTGASVDVISGAGGTSLTGAGGAGGAASFFTAAGAGSVTSPFPSGAGGDLSYGTGDGGTSAVAAGGFGGAVTGSTGDGGDASGAFVSAGGGGSHTVTLGDGGTGTGGTAFGGLGGTFNWTTGSGGEGPFISGSAGSWNVTTGDGADALAGGLAAGSAGSMNWVTGDGGDAVAGIAAGSGGGYSWRTGFGGVDGGLGAGLPGSYSFLARAGRNNTTGAPSPGGDWFVDLQFGGNSLATANDGARGGQFEWRSGGGGSASAPSTGDGGIGGQFLYTFGEGGDSDTGSGTAGAGADFILIGTGIGSGEGGRGLADGSDGGRASNIIINGALGGEATGATSVAGQGTSFVWSTGIGGPGLVSADAGEGGDYLLTIERGGDATGAGAPGRAGIFSAIGSRGGDAGAAAVVGGAGTTFLWQGGPGGAGGAAALGGPGGDLTLLGGLGGVGGGGSGASGSVITNAWTFPFTVVDTFSMPTDNGAAFSVLTDVAGTGALTFEALAFALGYIDGLHIENDTVTPDEIVDIDPGQCRDSTDAFNMVVGATVSPDITASGADGLDTGAVAADTKYAVFAIVDSTAVNPPAGLFSLSATAPTVPAGYDAFRRVGWIRTDATSDIETFQQPKEEDRNRWVYFMRETQIQAAGTAAAFVDTATLASDSVPETATRQQIGIQATKDGGSSTTARVEVVPDGWDETAGAMFWQSPCAVNSAEDITVDNTVEMPIGPTRLVRYRVQPAGDAIADIFVKGYQDTL